MNSCIAHLQGSFKLVDLLFSKSQLFVYTFSHCFKITCLLTMEFKRRVRLLCNCSRSSFRILLTASESDGILGINLSSITWTLSSIVCFADSVSKTAFWMTSILGWISWTTKFSSIWDLLKLNSLKSGFRLLHKCYLDETVVVELHWLEVKGSTGKVALIVSRPPLKIDVELWHRGQIKSPKTFGLGLELLGWCCSELEWRFRQE